MDLATTPESPAAPLITGSRLVSDGFSQPSRYGSRIKGDHAAPKQGRKDELR
jgi:hypothetical protein